jgi:hypothetical protein
MNVFMRMKLQIERMLAKKRTAGGMPPAVRRCRRELQSRYALFIAQIGIGKKMIRNAPCALRQRTPAGKWTMDLLPRHAAPATDACEVGQFPEANGSR